MPSPRHCTALTARGQPCKAWAQPGTEPPLCAAHNPKTPTGAPPHNRNAQTHGAYTASDPPPATIAAIIADLAAKQLTLSTYIDLCLSNGTATPADVARLLALHGQNASRLGRLLRDQAALGGDSLDALDIAVNAALDELAEELGIEL